VLGAVVAISLATATGRIGDGGTDTVVLPGAPAVQTAAPRTASSRRRAGFDAARVYAARAPGVVTVYALFGDHSRTGDAAQGSGFVVSGDGLVLTSAHVVTTASRDDNPEAAARAFVQFADGDRVPARVVGWDVFNDVAVLRVDPDDHALRPLPLGDSARVRVGEPVAAIGSPFGEDGSLAVGVVSATGRSIAALTSAYQIVDAIQVDAPINRGNSGGPLLDGDGNVIGINAQIRSSSGTAEGVGFAVPIASARRSLTQLVEDGEVSYAFAGIRADDLTPAVARRLDAGVRRGALIVGAEGPARSAGLRGSDRAVEVNGVEVRAGGDVIVAVNGRPVRTSDDLVRIIARDLRPGQVARFSLVRSGRRLVVPVRLGERPAIPAG
jgi:S1-C subfamily serine protease